MIDEKEWNNFLADCKVYKDKIDYLISTTKEQERRIATLEQNNAITNMQYESIMEKLNKLVEQTIPQLSKEIQEIKEKPAKRYDTAIVAIISAIAGGIATTFINMLINK